MISALSWIRKGTAKETPDKFELTEERYAEIMKRATGELEDAREGLAAAKEAKKSEKKKKKVKQQERDAAMAQVEDDMAKFHLSDYDDEKEVDMDGPSEDVLELFMQDVKGMVKSSAGEDPFLAKEEASEAESDADDLRIRPTDSLVVTCKTSDDVSYLEVNLYEEDEDNSYVHHDVMLPTFPLCVEPIAYPLGGTGFGCFAAVGTFEPDIEVWNLNVLDAAYPEVILGSNDASAKSKKKKATPKRPNPHCHVDAVMSLAWNKQHGNMLLSSSADSTIKLWDLTTASAIRSFEHHTDKVQAVQWNPADSTRLVSASYDGSIVCFDARSPGEQLVWRSVLGGDVEALRWDPHRPECFAVSDESGLVSYIDARNPGAEPLFRLHAHAKATTAIDWHPSISGCLLTASADKSFKIWKTTDDTPVAVLSREPEVGKLFTAAFCPDSTFLLSVAGSRGDLRFFNLSKNEAIIEAFSSATSN